MSNYEDGIYQLLSKADNYIHALELHEKFPNIQKRVLNEFWNKVELRILQLIADTNFQFFRDTDIYKSWPRFSLHYPNENNIVVAYESLTKNVCIGIRVEVSHYDLETYKQMVAYVKKYPPLANWEANHVWVAFKYTDNDFGLKNIQIKALPEYREAFVEELATQLVNFAIEHESVYSDLIKISKGEL